MTWSKYSCRSLLDLNCDPRSLTGNNRLEYLGAILIKRTVGSMGRLPTPGGGLANETSASIFFISGKALSKNPRKLSLTRDSFESFSGKVMEENCSLMIGFGVENYTSSERMHQLTQQVKYQAARSCQGKHRIWEWIHCVLHSHTHYGECDHCFILKKKMSIETC